jgi:predicted MFS family arabinose efflux permease
MTLDKQKTTPLADDAGPARWARGIARALWGFEEIPGLGPVFVVTFASAIAFSTFWSYVGVWAVRSLGAQPPQVGVMFLFSASTSAVSAWLGGHLSDRLGRKPLIMFGAIAQSAFILSLTLVGHDVPLGIAIVVLAGVVGAPGRSAVSAIVADVIPGHLTERAYSSLRLATNLGTITGPPAAAILLTLGGWPAFLAGVATMGAVVFLVAFARLPSTSPTQRGEHGGVVRSFLTIVLDGPPLLLLLSTLFGFMVYTAFDTVLPVVSVSSFHLAPAAWGLLVIINPLLTTLLQVRLTRWTERYSSALKLCVAMLLMGPPFLLLLLSSSIPLIVLIIVVFVFGEMLWLPTSQALAARMAPADRHGAYMGAFLSSTTLAWMIAPLLSLQLRAARGDPAMWVFFTLLALAGAAVGVAASRAGARRLAAAHDDPAVTPRASEAD